MPRMFQVFSIIAVLVTAVSAHAQPAGQVVIDFPGATAVEAGMSDPKPVDPDPEGRRRATIVTPVGDTGTIYAMTRADGTTVVRLVSTGDPAPAGFKEVGTYRDGDHLTFDVAAMTLATAVLATAAMHNNAVGRFGLGVSVSAGTGSFLNVVSRNCANIEADLGLDCDGEDRGPIWAVHVDGRWYISPVLDAIIRFGFINPDVLTINSTGTFENTPVTLATRKTGNLWDVSAALGYSFTPRFRVFAGGGLMKFDLDVTNTVTAFNQTNTEMQNFWGWGRQFFGGGEFFLNRRVSIFGEFGGAWLKDLGESGDDDDFDETYSRMLVGFRIALAGGRPW